MPATGPRSERLRGEVFLPSVFLEAGVTVALCVSQCTSEQMITGEMHRPTLLPMLRSKRRAGSIHVDTQGKKREREWSRGTMEVMGAAPHYWPAEQMTNLRLSVRWRSFSLFMDREATSSGISSTLGTSPQSSSSLSSLTRRHIKG